MVSASGRRVVVVHDYATQRGGAERVALDLLGAFPGAPLVTSAYNPATTFPGFEGHRIRTMWVDRVPTFRRDPRLALPVLAPTFSRYRVDDADVVVCSTSGWAHGVRTSAPKIVYCHNPAHWLYEPTEYLRGQSPAAALALRALGPSLRRWDRAAALSADRYVANSSKVAAQVRELYGIEAEVIAPPLSLDVGGPLEPVPGLEPGFLLNVSRQRGYKNVELVCRAVEALAGERLVTVSPLPPGEWSPRITSVGSVSDAQLRWLYANARALVSAALEDFGLTPIEANAFGTPAILLRSGGFLETLVEGVTGHFIEGRDVASVVAALQRPLEVDPDKIREHAASYSQETFAARMNAVVDEVLA